MFDAENEYIICFTYIFFSSKKQYESVLISDHENSLHAVRTIVDEL